jgi:murein DD-endopeptidase MepM/ murein hydrolase activator NlpD
LDSKNIARNYVVIRLDAKDICVGLAHLQQGSVSIKLGERVQPGQLIARVGNSGNTTEPHLHIHAKRGGRPNSMLDGEGVPMCFGGRWFIRNSILHNTGNRL